jgi:ubiquinone/menaquinone biosynthesis C-methylase UbiE
VPAPSPDRRDPHESDGGPSSGDETYRRYTRRVLQEVGEQGLDEAMARAIGTSSLVEFHRSGQMELDLLVQSGLRPDDYLVDVGCGSGRLTSKLAGRHTGRYLGTELSPELLDYARLAAPDPSWRFEVVDGLRIPEQDDVVDMVCFFSVLTHLRHEESYLYLEEARRVLKPGGRIVFSFLDFSQGNHRLVFEATVDARRKGDDLHVNQFVSVDAIEVWARMLGMEVEAVHGGAKPYIRLSASPHYEEGETTDSLGQSACVLVKPAGPTAV